MHLKQIHIFTAYAVKNTCICSKNMHAYCHTPSHHAQSYDFFFIISFFCPSNTFLFACTITPKYFSSSTTSILLIFFAFFLRVK